MEASVSLDTGPGTHDEPESCVGLEQLPEPAFRLMLKHLGLKDTLNLSLVSSTVRRLVKESSDTLQTIRIKTLGPQQLRELALMDMEIRGLIIWELRFDELDVIEELKKIKHIKFENRTSKILSELQKLNLRLEIIEQEYLNRICGRPNHRLNNQERIKMEELYLQDSQNLIQGLGKLLNWTPNLLNLDLAGARKITGEELFRIKEMTKLKNYSFCEILKLTSSL